MIGQYVWEKHTDSALIDEVSDKIPDYFKELEYYDITNVLYDEITGVVTIWTGRPGIIIGVKGSNIAAMETKMKFWSNKEGLRFEKLKLHEDNYSLKQDLYESSNLYAAMSERESNYFGGDDEF
jgi:ribosomal protein S3